MKTKLYFTMLKINLSLKIKQLAIAGGGDSAVDWAIELSEVSKKIFFIHRRKT